MVLVIFLFGVIICFNSCRADLDEPPTLMINEIKFMARNNRLPTIIFDMIKKCETIEADERKNILGEWRKCVTGLYGKPFTSLLDSLTNDCNAFSTTQHCYEPMIKVANSCYGEGSDSFEFTKALMKFICQNKERTVDQIQNSTQKFSALDSSTASNIDSCLAHKYANQPHHRNETCKARDLVEQCLEKYTANNSDATQGGNFFKQMMASVKEEVHCDILMNPTTAIPIPNNTGKNISTSSPAQSSSGVRTMYILNFTVQHFLVYFTILTKML